MSKMSMLTAKYLQCEFSGEEGEQEKATFFISTGGLGFRGLIVQSKLDNDDDVVTLYGWNDKTEEGLWSYARQEEFGQIDWKILLHCC